MCQLMRVFDLRKRVRVIKLYPSTLPHSDYDFNSIVVVRDMILYSKFLTTFSQCKWSDICSFHHNPLIPNLSVGFPH